MVHFGTTARVGQVAQQRHGAHAAADLAEHPLVGEDGQRRRGHQGRGTAARRQRRAQPWGGPPGARRATPAKTPQISHAHTACSTGCARSRLAARLSSSRPPRHGRPLRAVAHAIAAPSLDPAPAAIDRSTGLGRRQDQETELPLTRSYLTQGMRMLAVTWTNDARGRSAFWLHAALRHGIWPSVDDQLGITPRASSDSSGYISKAQNRVSAAQVPF
jgi:hypothetical protein